MKSIAAIVVVICAGSAFAQYWAGPMHAVHAQFTGTPKTYALWGDSITVSGAFNIAGYPSNVGPEAAPAVSWVNTKESMAGRRAQSSTEAGWALQPYNATQRNIDFWLSTDKPEMAVIMWGTNDARHGVSTATYQANLTEIVRTCKANGTIPILTAPLPQHAVDMAPFADVVNAVALSESVPVIDYYNAVLSRNPGTTWDGKVLYDANPAAYGNDSYNVPTLVSGDGIHPSNTYAYQYNFGATALATNGFNLRNYVSLLKAYEVYQGAIVTPEPATVSLLGLGALALLKRRKAK
jgi:lysophospholipase L1-like esterase